MNEEPGELIDRGWKRTWSILADVFIVQRMRCRHHQCGGHLLIEAWAQGDENPTKQFTVCRTCGHRKPF